MATLVKYNAWSKFQLDTLTEFTPELIREVKNSAGSTGYLYERDRLFAAMLREWDVLQKDVFKVYNGLASLDWKAVPFAEDGEAPTQQAQAVAATVNNAMWHARRQECGAWGHGFADLVGSVWMAKCRSVNVHEIVWQQEGGLWFPAYYLPVLPTFYGWETAQDAPDRLLLFRNADFLNGEPFPPNKFIVAMNNEGPDHPLHNASFMSLVGWFGASKWGLQWLLEFCQLYGKPLRKFYTANDEEKRKLLAELASQAVLSDVVLDKSTGEDVTIDAAGTATAIPQRELIEMAERQVHKLILGQTLTSDTSEHGGSLAQAKVHAGVERSEMLAAGRFVADVLTAQLVPAIVRMNYGRTEGLPLPEIRCSVPGVEADLDKLALFDGVINRLGLPLRRSDLYDAFALPQPAEGDDVVGPSMQPGHADPISAAAAARYPRSTASVDDYAARAEGMAKEVAAKFMGPVLDAIEAARDAGLTPQQFRAMIPHLEAGVQDLADALTASTAAGLGMAPVTADAITADNPGGCNQHGDNWTGLWCPWQGAPGVGGGKGPKPGGGGHGGGNGGSNGGQGGGQGGNSTTSTPKGSSGGDENARKMQDHHAKIEAALGTKAADRFRDQMNGAADEVKAVFHKYADELGNITERKSGVSSCRMTDPPAIFINPTNNDADNEYRTPGQTYIHEQGHGVDALASRGKSGNVSSDLEEPIKEDVTAFLGTKKKELREQKQQRAADILKNAGNIDLRAMTREAAAVMSDLLNAGAVSRSEVSKWHGSMRIELPAAVRNAIGETNKGKPFVVPVAAKEVKAAAVKELNALGKQLAAVSDAFGAHNVMSAFRHSASYYRNRTHAGSLETFANLYATYAINDKKSVQAAEKYLPKTTEAFKKLLGGLV